MKLARLILGLLALVLPIQAQDAPVSREAELASGQSQRPFNEDTVRALARVTKRIQGLLERTLGLLDQSPAMPAPDRASLAEIVDDLAGMLHENASNIRKGNLTLEQLKLQEQSLEILEKKVADIEARLGAKNRKPSQGGQP